LGPPLARLAEVEVPDGVRKRAPEGLASRMPGPLRRRLSPPPAAAEAPGRLPSLGQDADEGHRSYVASLDEGGVRWLNTKPFSAPPNYELARCLHSFAHIVEYLSLPHSAQVLDVGCGPGWISEWLARCGYHVTGVDVSADMVAIARQRLERVPVVDDTQPTPQADFEAMASDELPYEDRFDAAVLYDAMHHFTDEGATLAAVHRSLIPGGRIYIHEGVRPPAGSQGERELIEEMERYGTLESPFDPAYLVQALEEAGFVDIERYVEADRLLDLSSVKGELAELRRRAEAPETNTIIARKPIPSDEAPGRLVADIAVDEVRAGETGMTVGLTISNAGGAFWTAAGRYPFPVGSVTIAPYVPRADGGRGELDRVALPRSVPAGGSVEVTLKLERAALGDARELAVDLVAEGVCWFAEGGSRPALVPLPEG
ncbi:MAG: class I SAM-dependent methyltransferase, partial [Miltoncostaeaceae bacterium]